MKKIFSVLMVMILVLNLCIPVSASETENKSSFSAAGNRLNEYIQEDNQDLLLSSDNFGYMSFIKSFNDNAGSLYLLKMIDLLIGTGTEPDTDKYLDVLTNIIATYDLDNADIIAEQKEMDNLKNLKDYAIDCAEIAQKSISVMSGTNKASSKIEKAITSAVNGLNVLIENTDNWINALSNLETIVQDYTAYDEFLKVIEEKSEGNLKNAASILRTGLEQAFLIKLDTYNDVLESNYENYQEFFFSDVFFDTVKQLPEYEKNAELKYFVDSGDKIVSSVNIIKDSWELGLLIGNLVGDTVVGATNLINRTLEMMALYEISDILQDKILDSAMEFADSAGTDKEEELIEQYILFSQYLIGCRIRGEYCLYSIVANDAALLSWANKGSAEDAQNWYDQQCKGLLNLQEKLLEIKAGDLSDTVKDDTEKRYSAYAAIVQQYESEYGSAEIVKLNDWYSRMTGLCFMKLVDFSHNGQEELLLVYQKNAATASDEYPVYTYEIWGYSKEKAVMLDTGELFGTDGNVKHVYLTECNGKIYLVTGGSDSFGYYYYHGYSGDEFCIVKEIVWEQDNSGELLCYIDGTSVSESVLESEQEKWFSNVVEYNLNYDCELVLNQNEETKQKLLPYYEVDNQTQVEKNDASNISDTVYEKEKIYAETLESTIWEWAANEVNYAYADLDKDGIEELIVSSDEDGLGFATYKVYTAKGTDKKVKCVGEFYAYLGAYICEGESIYLVYTETRPNSQSAVYEYAQLVEDSLQISFSLSVEEVTGSYTIMNGIDVVRTMTMQEFEENYAFEMLEFFEINKP